MAIDYNCGNLIDINQLYHLRTKTAVSASWRIAGDYGQAKKTVMRTHITNMF